ncbi:hypothetical protein DFQ09_1211 [Winogradskyella pacifica]|uniref:Uncharacterized protein n=1 Tax=Winogradskyella pacifica TaxID=664642 RepID=A0A3D9LML9_9FLAO|nr:hypothetical protein [Winogradskyella pacifica]REE07607.1 hypothetical protein DFQ09_1211 [Winogradskyella pacifica]
MKKTTVILFNLFCFLNIFAQNDSIKTIDFRNVEKKLLTSTDGNVNNQFKYDFKIIDSLYFYENSYKKDLLTTEYKKDFELLIGDRKSIIKFECKESIPETCYRYAGYSNNAEVYLISKCRDVCELYLIDAYNGSTLSVSSEFDGGSFPVFLYGYMILYSSYYDDSYGKCYDYRSIIDIYKMYSTNNIEQNFKYVGSINSKNWSIRELYESNNQNSFLMKIYDERNEFDYIEITIE